MSNLHDELEWKTRKERIDKSLEKHWTIVNYTSSLDHSTLNIHVVTEYPTANGPADYVFFINEKLVAVLEAKKVSTAVQEVLGQSKRYSRGMENGIGNWDGYKIPLLYSSNGEITWFVDIRNSKNIRRKTNGIHTPDAMLEILGRNIDNAMDKLKNNSVETNSRLRPYQITRLKIPKRLYLKISVKCSSLWPQGQAKHF